MKWRIPILYLRQQMVKEVILLRLGCQRPKIGVILRFDFGINLLFAAIVCAKESKFSTLRGAGNGSTFRTYDIINAGGNV